MDKNNAEKTEVNGELVPFDKWLRSIGRNRVTGWKWRKSGAVKAINVFGRLYITRAEIARFLTRAANGEFAHCQRPHAAAVKRAKSSRGLSGLIKALPKFARRARLLALFIFSFCYLPINLSF